MYAIYNISIEQNLYDIFNYSSGFKHVSQL